MRTIHGIHLRHFATLPTEKLAREPGGLRPLVMVIDDSPTVRKILETCLLREDYPVASFADGVSALRWIKGQEQALPRLILLDLVLPGMPGLEVARALKKLPQMQGTLLVVLSRRASLIDRLHARLAGADLYLVKPFRTQEILSLAAQVSQQASQNTPSSRAVPQLHQMSTSSVR